jgi:hypothetical protein
MAKCLNGYHLIAARSAAVSINNCGGLLFKLTESTEYTATDWYPLSLKSFSVVGILPAYVGANGKPANMARRK